MVSTNELNLEHLVSIKKYVDFPNVYYKYHKGFRILGITLKKAGFYNFWGDLVKKIPEDLKVVGYDLVLKPHIELCFSNNTNTTIFFETEEELDKYVITIKEKYGVWV